MLNEFPTEVLVKIFIFLNFNERLIITRVCKRFKDILYDSRNLESWKPVKELEFVESTHFEEGEEIFREFIKGQSCVRFLGCRNFVEFLLPEKLFNLLNCKTLFLTTQKINFVHVEKLFTFSLKNVNIKGCNEFYFSPLDVSPVYLVSLTVSRCTIVNSISFIQFVETFKPKNLYLLNCGGNMFIFLPLLCNLNERLNYIHVTFYENPFNRTHFVFIVQCVEILSSRNQSCSIFCFNCLDRFRESENEIIQMLKPFKCQVEFTKVSVTVTVL